MDWDTVFKGYWPITATLSDYIKSSQHVFVANGLGM
jgi:hypothetical protein